MQAAARTHWEAQAATGGIPDPLGDFGFWNGWEYVRDSCQIASQLKILPRAGGLDDQDPLWVVDLKTYLAGLSRARYEQNPNAYWGESAPIVGAPVSFSGLESFHRKNGG